ncbi:unnamed protein product [Acanthosepion pharaonis]|uniref:Uncharacterized protein n=1 Tax=Acanthosepion pharaonis TaxID=158019 RepID=A0A812B4M9_ACAPH|nr:unnamed protein product [Sepia pharaonis]
MFSFSSSSSPLSLFPPLSLSLSLCNILLHLSCLFLNLFIAHQFLLSIKFSSPKLSPPAIIICSFFSLSLSLSSVPSFFHSLIFFSPRCKQFLSLVSILYFLSCSLSSFSNILLSLFLRKIPFPAFPSFFFLFHTIFLPYALPYCNAFSLFHLSFFPSFPFSNSRIPFSFSSISFFLSSPFSHSLSFVVLLSFVSLAYSLFSLIFSS